jgi:hypothetical protein
MKKYPYEVKMILPKDRWENADTIEIWYNEKLYFTWHQNANIDYPEDLSWYRMIQDVFNAGIELGKELK